MRLNQFRSFGSANVIILFQASRQGRTRRRTWQDGTEKTLKSSNSTVDNFLSSSPGIGTAQHEHPTWRATACLPVLIHLLLFLIPERPWRRAMPGTRLYNIVDLLRDITIIITANAAATALCVAALLLRKGLRSNPM